MEKQFVTILLLLLSIGLISQSKISVDSFQQTDQSCLNEFLAGHEHQANGKVGDFAEHDIFESRIQLNEMILDSSLQFHYNSISDSVKERKTEYKWYPWGDYKADYIFEWDEPNNLWVNYEKIEYVFDANSVYYGFDMYTWDIDSNDWINYTHSETTYDDYGNRDSSFSLIWKQELQRWDKSHLFVYDYDDNGNQLSFIWWMGDENNQWVRDNKREYSYNPDATKSIETYASWDMAIEDWVLGSQTEYYYNDSNLLDSSYYFIWEPESLTLNYESQYSNQVNPRTTNVIINDNYTGNEWTLKNKHEYYYDENNNQVLMTYYWWADEQWYIGHKTEYEYDDHNNEVLYLSYSWNSSNSIWTVNSKWEHGYSYEYSEEGVQTMSSAYDWDEDYGIWIGRFKREYVYDNDGKYLIRKKFNWNVYVNDWDIDEKSYYYRSEFDGVPEFDIDDFLVYPNPVESSLTIRNLSNKEVHCSVISTSGQKIMQFKMAGSDAEINVEGFPTGVYFLQIDKGATTTVKKLIKQ